MKKFLICFIVVAALSVRPVGAQQEQALGAGMQLTAAVISEQNITFAVVLVKSAILNNKELADDLIQMLEQPFGGIPVVLMVQDDRGRPSFYGRPDIADFLSQVPLESIPWKKYVLEESKPKGVQW